MTTYMGGGGVERDQISDIKPSKNQISDIRPTKKSNIRYLASPLYIFRVKYPLYELI